jgi:23S rRNA (cytidine1920-2'-O)/16S rRNA (cytidine1409-2'-O)-methyltransferase
VVATKSATLVGPDASIRLVESGPRFVSRAGAKLDHALRRFAIDVAARRAIDVGASTGGFTDCLLQAGAASVCAVDVGYGQLHWSLRNDPRVDVVERTNIRLADPADLGAPFDVVVADVSFISLATIAEQLVALGNERADWVVLVKPQFEVGKDDVGSGGIVRDPALWSRAMSTVNRALGDLGLNVHGVDVSRVVGTKGNREFVVWYRTSTSHLDAGAAVAAAIRVAEETS